MIVQTVSHYRVLEKIGEGGMGVVYRAEDTRLRRTVALKFLLPDLTRDPAARERFVREARAAAALDHPNICTIHEIDEADGQVFIAMAFVEGFTLKRRIEESPIGVEETVRIVTHVAEGLRAAHQRGVVHRDIKPANIMLTCDGQVRIMDFGLARLERATELTTGGTIMGTLAYMSPEQARGERVDHRTDLWSLGCVLYEMLAGRAPFRGATYLETLHAIAQDEPAPVSATRVEVPARLTRVVQTCLQKEPSRRYGRADDLLADLKQTAASHPAAAAPSIAVLPFVDMSPGKDQEHFCDGIAEELINGLAHIKGLRVVARTSAFAFKGQNVDVRDIGRRLNVGTVLEGSIRKSGNRLRITAQLIDVEEGYHLWSDKFDRSTDDIFEIQDEVAGAVVENLRVTLLASERAAIEKRYTSDSEAYELYLRGRYFFSRPTAENVRRAIACFQQAVARDPRFALAWAGIAETHAAIAVMSLGPPRDRWLEVRAPLEKAIGLDPNLADAHGVAALQAVYFDWDWESAEHHFRSALAINPGLATARGGFAWFCAFMGRFDEAVREMRRALDVDPLLPLFGAWMIGVLVETRRFEEAVAEFHKAVEIDPQSPLAYFHGGCACLGAGRLDEARSALERSLALTEFAGWAEGMLGVVLVAQGRRDEAERILQTMIDKRKRGYISPVCTAFLCWRLGRAEQTYEYFDRAFEERDTLVPLLGVYPFFDDLRGEPRFQAILDRLRFPARR